MASKEHKYTENVDGAFYVDEECIVCDACMEVAPDHFVITEDNDHVYIRLQPQSDTEQKACLDALEACPVDAIGQDGA